MGESKAVVEDFIRAGGYTLPVLLDIDGKVSSLYNVRSHPKTLIIDPSGRVIGIASGYREWDSKAMLTLFKKLLSKNQSS